MRVVDTRCLLAFHNYSWLTRRKFEAVPQEAIDSVKFIPDLPIVLPDRDSKQISGHEEKASNSVSKVPSGIEQFVKSKVFRRASVPQ